jgi:hypothetical protein
MPPPIIAICTFSAGSSLTIPERMDTIDFEFRPCAETGSPAAGMERMEAE